METILQVAEATSRAHSGAVQIVKKLLGEVEENYRLPALGLSWNVDPFQVLRHDLNFVEEYWGNSYLDIEAFGRFAGCDFALELKGKKLWLWSVKVVRA